LNAASYSFAGETLRLTRTNVTSPAGDGAACAMATEIEAADQEIGGPRD
jgi:hypothetical protein